MTSFNWTTLKDGNVETSVMTEDPDKVIIQEPAFNFKAFRRMQRVKTPLQESHSANSHCLCHICELVVRNIEQWPVLGWHGYKQRMHRTAASVLDAANAGCCFCRAVVFLDERFLQDPELPGDTSCLSIWTLCAPQSEEHEHMHWVLVHQFQGFLFTYDLVDASMLDTGPELDDYRNYLQDWTTFCDHHHKCVSIDEKDPSVYPTRLVYIETDEGGALRCRLIESETNAPKGPYVTLSHCWGDPATVPKVTKSTYASFLEEIPQSVLSKTFAQAISAAAQLQCSYIWIDSLCIIQDSENDWAKEAALMAQVYENSYCSLAAAGSSDGNGGLLRNGIQQRRQSSRITASFESIPLYQYEVIDSMRAFHYDKSRLMKRAWVLQELCLAKRVAIFGLDRLYWHCHALSASETFPRGVQDLAREPPMLYGEFHTGIRLELLDMPSNALRAKAWRDLVQTYSHCGLSFGKDKLIAISGLAKVFKSFFDTQYIAGLWRSHLLEGLTWYVNHGLPGHRSDAYRAPSFSWAGIDGSVEYHLLNEDPGMRTQYFSRTIDVSLTPAGPDSTGIITDGFIRMQGTLHGLDEWYQKPMSELNICEGGESFTNPDMDGCMVWMDCGAYDLREAGRYTCSPDSSEPPLPGTHTASDTWPPTSDFFCHPLLVQARENDFRFFALVLMATSTRGQYRRIGLLTLRLSKPEDGSEPRQILWSSYAGTWEDKESVYVKAAAVHDLGPEHGEDFDPQRGYTFTLI